MGGTPTLHMSVSQFSSPLPMKPWMMKRVLRSSWKLEASTVARSVAVISWFNYKKVLGKMPEEGSQSKNSTIAASKQTPSWELGARRWSPRTPQWVTSGTYR